MALRKDRFVTVCQQLLVTAAVSTLAVTAASVVTLDIIGPEGAVHEDTTPTAAGARPLVLSATTQESEVDSAPVTPDVEQVPVAGTAAGLPAGVNARAATPARVHGMPVVATSTPQDVGGYATVGAVWDHGVHVPESAIVLQVRTRKSGHWSPWQHLPYHDDHGAGGAEGAAAQDRPGTDPMAVGHVDKVQLRVAAASGHAPAGLDFTLIDPGSGPTRDEAPASGPTVAGDVGDGTTGSGSMQLSAARTDAMAVAPRPEIYTRSQWGADERIRESGNPDYGTIKTGFVHHTVNANKYSRKAVPAMIRGIYAYHVKARGWRDIGYNFLVDRFGRIWEGRYGGINKAVVGAHTLGYNEVSFAMSAIGNYDIAEPPKPVIHAFARLFAWKLSLYGIPARAKHLLVKGRYLHAINGHRDVGHTACPGRYLYAKLPAIRQQAAKIQQAAQVDLEPVSKYDPTHTPDPARPQPKNMTFVNARNVADSPHADLVLQSPDGTMSVLSLGGLTGFNPVARSRGTWSGQRVVAVGDLNGDGRGEVVTKAGGAAGWQIHAGVARDKVAPGPMDSRLPFKRARQIIPAGDWNGDGRTDLLAVDKSDRLIWYQGRGRARFAKPKRLAQDWPYRKTVVAGDLDGDGHPDLVGIGNDGDMYRIDSLSPNTLGSAVHGRDMSTVKSIAGGGDMSGDGIGDLWVRDRATNEARIMLGDGHGRFRGALGPFRGFGTWTTITGVRMNGDKRPDIVGVNPHGRLVTKLNNAMVNVRALHPSGVRAGGSSQVLSVGDWDRDGRADVITRQDDGDVLVLHRGLGGGRFAAGVAMSAGWRTIRNLTAVGDITGDRHPDLVGRNRSGPMLVFAGNGKQGFHRVRRLAGALRTFKTTGGPVWRPGQFPGSGLRSSDGSFVPFDGTAGQRVLRLATGTRFKDYDAVVGVGDVDGDGRPDVLARDRARGTLWLIPGRAHGFGPRSFVASGLGKYRIGG